MLSATSQSAVVSQNYAASPICPDLLSSLLCRSEASSTLARVSEEARQSLYLHREREKKRKKRKERKKNSYVTRGIKGPVYSLQVALSGGAAYKESYLVIFSVNQTCSRRGSFWCGREYSFYKQGHVFGFVHRPLFSFPDTQALYT